MRILFLASRDLCNPYIGGGDMYINELAKGCAKKVHSVTILSSKSPECKAEEYVENVRVIRLGTRFTMFLKVFAYYFLHLRGQFDVVVEEVMGGPRIPFFASLYMKERLVGVLHQRHAEIFRQQFSFPIASLLSLLERFLVLLYRDNQLIVNSLRTKEDLRGIGYHPENMHVVYPGLPNYFFQSENKGFYSRKCRVICLTKIRRYKLIDQAIRAMEKVNKVMPNCELVIAGRTNDVDPEYENELRQLVLELGLRDKIHFDKDISEGKKIRLLKSSRALILPSVLEGFGIVVIEANACGTPAIVSDRVPAAMNGSNAIVVPCFDIDSLSKAIITLLSDEKRWCELSARSFELAKHFTWETSVNQFIAVIEDHSKQQNGASR
jgi:glycosyltransferase involved in cell wall biosynthesis